MVSYNEGGNVTEAADLGGPGGYVKATVTVDPGATVHLRVGGEPTGTAGGYNGGGTAGASSTGSATGAGGGATDVRLGGDDLAHRIMVAGGGGGGAYNSDLSDEDGEFGPFFEDSQGGGGGGSSGGEGMFCGGDYGPGPTCGSGASMTAAGGPGYSMTPCAVTGNAATGGDGCGGGGGGGYYGGGGGGFYDGPSLCCSYLSGDVAFDGPGGGGSGYVTPSATAVSTQTGLEFGNGMVRISYASSQAHGGLNWSTPTVIDPDGVLSGISCPTATFCMAVDGAGNAATYDGTTWSSFASVAGSGNTFYGVSCSSATFCAVVGTDPGGPNYDTALALIEDDGVWSSNTTQTLYPGEALTAVSCAKNSHSCQAVGSYENGPDSDGVVQTYNGTSWTVVGGPGGYGYDNYLGAVSCASPEFCAAAGSYGDRLPFGDWLGITDHGKTAGDEVTDNPVVGLSGGLNAVACAASSCVVAGDGPYVFNVKKTVVGQPTAPNGQSTITALSCSSGSSCWAVGDGYAIEDTAGTWSVSVQIDPGANLISISCPTKRFCAAVDSDGAFIKGT
jgi:hypothetical protein